MRHGGGWDGTVVKWEGVKNEARLRRSEMGIGCVDLVGKNISALNKHNQFIQIFYCWVVFGHGLV